MQVRIEVNKDVALADVQERSVGWWRGSRDVARRFLLEPEGQFVARGEDGRVLGTAAIVTFPGPELGPIRALAWIGGMVVRPEARGQGVGRRLLRAALGYAEARGVRVVGLDATDEGRPLYESEGFHVTGTSSRWRRKADAPSPAPPEASRVALHPFSIAELVEVLAYDASRFGAQRARYLASLVEEFPERGFVARDRTGGHVVGFVLAHELYVGPLVCEASDVGAWLLWAAERAGAPPVVHALDQNAKALEMFRGRGYAFDGARVHRMTRGGPLPGRPETLYAAAAWAFG